MKRSMTNKNLATLTLQMYNFYQENTYQDARAIYDYKLFVDVG